MSNNHIIKDDLIKNLFFNLIAKEKWNTIFELIQENQLDINYRDKNGRNALFWAIHTINTDAIKKLLELGIDLNVTNNLSALNYAVYKDSVKVIKCLKNCGLDLNETDDVNSTPIIYAVLYNKLNSINYLINNDADIFHEDFLGNSAFSLAHDLKIKYLIEIFSNKINRTTK